MAGAPGPAGGKRTVAGSRPAADQRRAQTDSGTGAFESHMRTAGGRQQGRGQAGPTGPAGLQGGP